MEQQNESTVQKPDLTTAPVEEVESKDLTQNNKMICHFCGGAAISVSDKVFRPVSELGDGFANVEFHYVDTSTANISKIQPLGEFWQVETSLHGKEKITGSGGERTAHINDARVSINKYLDNGKWTKMIPTEYHIVVSSASGGSGNVLAYFVADRLLRIGIPVVMVTIGDSSSGLMAFNTKNYLASLNNLAVQTGKALSIIYVNNHAIDGGAPISSEKEADKMLYNYISTLALFLSSNNGDIDAQDMRNIIDQASFKTIRVAPGLFGLQFFSKEVKLPAKAIPMGGRTLITPGVEFNHGLNLLHHKHGVIQHPDAIAIFKDQLPLYMISSANFLTIENEGLEKVTNDYYNVMDSIEVKEVKGTTRSQVDEDTGLVL